MSTLAVGLLVGGTLWLLVSGARFAQGWQEPSGDCCGRPASSASADCVVLHSITGEQEYPRFLQRLVLEHPVLASVCRDLLSPCWAHLLAMLAGLAAAWWWLSCWMADEEALAAQLADGEAAR